MGREDLDVKMEILRTRLCELLFSEGVPVPSKSLIIEFLLILVTASSPSLTENPLIGHLMSDHLFDALVTASLNLTSRHVLGFKALLLLTLLVNYKSEDCVNPFIVKLSLIQDEVVLNAFAHVICSEICDFNRRFEIKNESAKNSGSLFSSITSMVSSLMISGGDDESLGTPAAKALRSCGLRANHNSLLLALYHAIHLNRNFIILLTNFAAEPMDDEALMMANSGPGCPSRHPDSRSATLRSTDSNAGPSNLLVAFLEFCSIVMLNTKDESSCRTSRLCFVMLTCIAEDSCANAIMHDSNIAFRVSLQRMPMRHRKLSHDQTRASSKPLAHTVLDLMVEFMLSNLRKSLPLDLHAFALGIIQRIIVYQKRCRTRFSYPWTEVWSTLISLIKFLVNHETELLKVAPSSHLTEGCLTVNNNGNNILSLIQSAINIFNLFIMFGDAFLASDKSYDQLYYEIIRQHMVFDNLYLLCCRFTGMENSPFKQASADIVTSLTNVRSIINHFNPKIDAWKSEREIESLTEENVLDVVRSNYDSLVVMMQEGLDSCDPYSCEAGNEAAFFQSMLEQVINEYRDNGGLREQEYAHKHAIIVNELESSCASSCSPTAGDLTSAAAESGGRDHRESTGSQSLE